MIVSLPNRVLHRVGKDGRTVCGRPTDRMAVVMADTASCQSYKKHK